MGRCPDPTNRRECTMPAQDSRWQHERAIEVGGIADGHERRSAPAAIDRRTDFALPPAGALTRPTPPACGSRPAKLVATCKRRLALALGAMACGTRRSFDLRQKLPGASRS